MRFEARELRPYIEHVPVEDLVYGEVYFIVWFLDGTDMLVPELKPVVYVGRNLAPGDMKKLYFQDFVSYQDGVRYETAAEPDDVEFQCFYDDQTSGVCDYERALDGLLHCSLRRAKRSQDD